MTCYEILTLRDIHIFKYAKGENCDNCENNLLDPLFSG